LRRVLLTLGWYDYRLHRGIEKYAQAHAWNLSQDLAREKVIPWGWDGDGILGWLGAGDDLAEFVLHAGKPTVDFSYRRPHLPFAHVLEDHAAAGRLVAEHFLARRFRNFIYYSDAPNWVYQERVTRPGTPGIVKIRDTYIAPAPNETTPDGLYYLTGTTADRPDAWANYDGIELWSSPDRQNWTYLGFIWTFSVEAKAEPNAWFSQPLVYATSSHNGGLPYQLQVVWAPEIHFINGNWYIPFSMPGGATGILKSTTGKPTGPYRNAIPSGGFIARRIDADLFQDTDGRSITSTRAATWRR
jgi:hypothetical protein